MIYIICKVLFFSLLAQNISGASDIDQKALEKIVDSLWSLRVQEFKGIIDAQDKRIVLLEGINDAQDEQIALMKHDISFLKAPTKTSDDPTLEERVDYVEQLSRTKVLRTCHELMMHGVDKNDFYLVDPDGELIGQLPILVFCDFHSGTTEVIHDSEEMVKVERCLELGCFKHDIQYGVPMSQINALIELSQTCTQSINFGCFLAPLAVEGTQLGSWVDKNGDEQHFFTGSHAGEHICECGEDNSCISVSGTKFSCNCDSKIPDWTSDAGIITDMNLLPMVGFNYGPLEFEIEKANFTVGRLQCSGKKTVPVDEVSCQSLKKSGILTNSIYHLKKSTEDFPRLSMCNLEDSEGYEDPTMESLIGYMDTHSLPGGVMFAAQIVSSVAENIAAARYLTFTDLISNVANSFEKSTGTFTTPVMGTYEFSFSSITGTNGGSYAHIQVQKNGEVVSIIWDDNQADNVNNIGQTWQMNLQKGDTIKLYLKSGTIYITSVSHTVFIGKLVAE